MIAALTISVAIHAWWLLVWVFKGTGHGVHEGDWVTYEELVRYHPEHGDIDQARACVYLERRP